MQGACIVYVCVFAPVNGEQHDKYLQPWNFWPSRRVSQLSIKIVSVLLDRSVSMHFISSFFEHFGYHSK